MYRNFMLLLILVVMSGGMAFGQSQTSAPVPATRNAEAADQAQTLRALLEEIRLLRLALEKSQYNAVMVQATIERLRLQQDAVNRLTQKIDDCQSELIALQLSLPRLPDHIREIERRMNSAEDAGQRALVESEMKAAQQAYEEQKERSDYQRQRLDKLTAQLQDEQRKLDDLFEKFTQFERLITGQINRAPVRR